MLTKRWPLMFTSLFYTLDEIRAILDGTAFLFQFLPLPPNDEEDEEDDNNGGNNNSNATQNDGWENRTRDDFIHAYMDARKRWEKRTMESVNITFVACQVWLQSHVDICLEKLENDEYDDQGDRQYDRLHQDEDDNAGEGPSAPRERMRGRNADDEGGLEEDDETEASVEDDVPDREDEGAIGEEEEQEE